MLSIITFIFFSLATTKTATSFRGDAIPKLNATPFHTTAKKYTSTGQTATSTMSKAVNTSPLTDSNLKTLLSPSISAM